MKRVNVIILSALLCGFVFAGCDNSESAIPSEIIGSDVPITEKVSAFPIEVCNVQLTKAVERAVSLSPAVTEIITEIGFADKLVGVSDYCDYPENISAVKLGSPENPDLEAIMKLMPDAVFTLSPLSERETYLLNQANISVLNVSVPTSIDGYAEMYAEISAAFYGNEMFGEKEERRTDRIAFDARKSLENASEGISFGTFVYVTEKLTIAGADTFESAVLTLVGDNLCTDSGYISSDDFKGDYPKYIIADDELTNNMLRSNETIKSMIDNGAEICFVKSDCFERPTARTADVFLQIAEQTAGNVTSE